MFISCLPTDDATAFRLVYPSMMPLCVSASWAICRSEAKFPVRRFSTQPHLRSMTPFHYVLLKSTLLLSWAFAFVRTSTPPCPTSPPSRAIADVWDR